MYYCPQHTESIRYDITFYFYHFGISYSYTNINSVWLPDISENSFGPYTAVPCSFSVSRLAFNIFFLKIRYRSFISVIRRKLWSEEASCYGLFTINEKYHNGSTTFSISIVLIEIIHVLWKCSPANRIMIVRTIQWL